jgi:hypothetical protein
MDTGDDTEYLVDPTCSVEFVTEEKGGGGRDKPKKPHPNK